MDLLDDFYKYTAVKAEEKTAEDKSQDILTPRQRYMKERKKSIKRSLIGLGSVLGGTALGVATFKNRNRGVNRIDNRFPHIVETAGELGYDLKTAKGRNEFFQHAQGPEVEKFIKQRNRHAARTMAGTLGAAGLVAGGAGLMNYSKYRSEKNKERFMDDQIRQKIRQKVREREEEKTAEDKSKEEAAYDRDIAKIRLRKKIAKGLAIGAGASQVGSIWLAGHQHLKLKNEYGDIPGVRQHRFFTGFNNQIHPQNPEQIDRAREYVKKTENIARKMQMRTQPIGLAGSLAGYGAAISNMQEKQLQNQYLNRYRTKRKRKAKSANK